MVTEKTSLLVDVIHKFALFQLFSSAQASTSKTLLELSTHEISNLPKAPIAFQSGPETAWSNVQTVMSCLWEVQLTQHQSRFTIRRRWNLNNFSTDCQVSWSLWNRPWDLIQMVVAVNFHVVFNQTEFGSVVAFVLSEQAMSIWIHATQHKKTNLNGTKLGSTETTFYWLKRVKPKDF